MERDELSTTTGDSFSTLIRAAAGCDETPSATSGASAASVSDAARQSDGGWLAEASARVERRVMVEIARRSLERSRRRVRVGIVVCAMGFVMATAGALAALAAWSPVIVPGAERFSWFGQVRDRLSGALGGAVEAMSAGAFIERWGLTLLVALGAVGVAGLFYILDRAFSDDCV